jgi:purine-binding chemotaxis protein CheW
MKTQEKSLGELLRQAGKITSRQIQVALSEQKKSHEPIGKILVRLGFVEERDILQVMEGMVVLTFRMNQELYGVETFRAREVLKYVPLTPLAQPHEIWMGTVTLRGAILPVLSLRKYLGLGAGPIDNQTWFIVLEQKGRPFILWVDQVKEVTRFKIEQIEPLPPYLFGKKSDLYYCLGRIKEELYSIINPDKLVDESVLMLQATEVNHVLPT